MADVSAHTPIFSRGSTVLDYWLAHAEGLTIQPLGARVEEVVVVAPVGRAESLVVRSRVTRRRKLIPAAAIAAVTPSTGDLLLDTPPPRAPFKVPRPSPERIAAARAHAAGSVQRTQAGTRSAGAWLRPHATRAGETSARYGRLTAAGAAAGLAWLGPRIAEFAQLTARRRRPRRTRNGARNAPRRARDRSRSGSRPGVARSTARAPGAHAGRLTRRCCSSPIRTRRRPVSRGMRSGSGPGSARSSPRLKRRSTTAGPTIRSTARPTGCAPSTWAARESWMRSAASVRPAWSSCSGTTCRTSSARRWRRPTSTTRAPSAASGWAKSACGSCCSVCHRRRRTCDRLAELIDANAEAEQQELMWGSPGTILVGRELGLDVDDSRRRGCARNARPTGSGRRISTAPRGDTSARLTASPAVRSPSPTARVSRTSCAGTRSSRTASSTGRRSPTSRCDTGARS